MQGIIISDETNEFSCDALHRLAVQQRNLDSATELAVQLRGAISFDEVLLLPVISFLWPCGENERAKGLLIR